VAASAKQALDPFPGSAPAAATAEYRRRDPQGGVLHRVLRENLETFLARAQGAGNDGRGVPGFVEDELRSHLRCGVLAHGLIRVHCGKCRKDDLIALSCKRRGFCPRCGGRRMTELAAHISDHVLPDVPVRQWVLTLPYRLRFRLGYDHELSKKVLRIFSDAVIDYYRRATGERLGQTGSITFIQRFNSELALNVHFHQTAIDGVFVEDATGALRFVHAPEPEDVDVAEVLATASAKIIDLARRHGIELGGDPAFACDEPEPLFEDMPALAACYDASITRRTAFGQSSGARRPVTRIGGDPQAPWISPDRPRHAQHGGFDLHAGEAVPGSDRQGREQLLRYCARPAIAQDRLALTAEGKVSLQLRRPYYDGTTSIEYEPLAFIERLAALIPRPHKNLLVYRGVLAPRSALRARVVAYRPEVGPVAERGDAGEDLEAEPPVSEGGGSGGQRGYSWADLMRRAFKTDVLICPSCKGPRRLLAAVFKPDAIRRILKSLKLPTEPLPIAPARPPPGSEWFDFESA